MLETLLKPDDVEERCGLLLRDGTIVEIKNVAEDPKAGYEMDPAAALGFISTGEVVGTWHTHPDTDPNLSGDDYLGFAAWPEFEHHIIGMRDGEVIVTCWRIEDEVLVACD